MRNEQDTFKTKCDTVGLRRRAFPSDNLATSDGKQNTSTKTGNTTASITFHYCQKKQGYHME
jgi:hypothetical protein